MVDFIRMLQHEYRQGTSNNALVTRCCLPLEPFPGIRADPIPHYLRGSKGQSNLFLNAAVCLVFA